MKEVIFLDGKPITNKEAKISVSEPGFLYGWGLFETMRAYRGRIVYLSEHLKRLKSSSRLIRLECLYPSVKLKKMIDDAIALGNFKDAYVKLSLWKSEKDARVLIVARRYQPYPFLKYRRGFQAVISRFRQNEDSLLARIKTTNRLLYELSFREAKEKGFDEAVILNNRGYIAEASRSNIFLVKDNNLFTPALENGCLDGVTRKAIFDLAKRYKIKIYEGNLTVQDLYGVGAAFLTNSLMGVMPLVSVEAHPIADGAVDKLTRFFIKKYTLLLNGT